MFYIDLLDNQATRGCGLNIESNYPDLGFLEMIDLSYHVKRARRLTICLTDVSCMTAGSTAVYGHSFI